MKIRSIIHIIALGILLSMASSCSKENLINGGGENPLPEVPDGMVRLELITNSGDYEEPATRAVGDKLIKTPWVLVFKDTGTPANDLFVEAQQAVILNGISYVLLTKTTETALADRKRRLLVIANSEKFRTTADPNTEIVMSEANFNAQLKPAGVSKTFTEAINLLITSAPLATPQTTVPYTPDEPIPMSVEYKLPNGITKDTRIGGSESGDTPLKLRRAVAKVTVAVSADPAVGGFVLHGATVVDAPRDGYLCPAATPKNNTGNLTDYLTSPSGDGVTGIAPAGNVAGTITTAARPIYVYESGAGVTSVIIKGTYKGTIGYYRLAFLDNDNANAPMSILRNTHYQFNIVKVTGTGYPSVAEAKKNPPAHDILAKIEVSDDKSHDVISNGRYYLGCSNSDFLVYADGLKSNLIALTITTNATAADILADGTNSITATTTGGSAMTVSPAKIALNTGGAAKGTETEVKVNLPAGFSAGTLTLKLGNLVKTITVQRQPMLGYAAASKEFAANYVSGKVTAGGEWLSLGIVNDPDQSSAQVTRPDQPGSVYLFNKHNVAAGAGAIRTGGEVYLARHNNQGRIKIYADQDALNSYPAYPGVIGYDPVRGDLNLEGRGIMVFFKYGGIIAMYSGLEDEFWLGGSQIAFNPTDISIGDYNSFPTPVKENCSTVGKVDITESFHRNPANARNGNGDPCRFIKEDGSGMTAAEVKAALASNIVPDHAYWRLPTNAENSGFTTPTSIWTSAAATAAGDDTQRYGRTFTALNGFKFGNFLPAAGDLNNSHGKVQFRGKLGFFWSSTSHEDTSSRYMFFDSQTVYTSIINDQSFGFSVRCVSAVPPSLPAYPGVIGYDPETKKLNLDGKGVMVYFKFGSVVAMYSGLNGDTWSSDAVAFNPTNKSFDTYASIPYANSATFPTQNIAAGLGDPCRLAYKDGVVGTYKTPSGNPFPGFPAGTINTGTTSGNVSYTWNPNGGTTSTNLATGTFNLTGAAATTFGEATMVLPVAGHRHYKNGAVNYQGISGYYWSSTPDNATYGYSLRFISHSAYTNSYDQSNGHAIRCVSQP